MKLPEMNLTELLLLINTLWMLVMSAIGWSVSRSKANRAHIEDLRASHGKRLDTHADRITRLEAKQSDIPSKDDVTKLALEIKQLEGSLQRFGAELKGMENISKILKKQIDMMDGFLRTTK